MFKFNDVLVATIGSIQHGCSIHDVINGFLKSHFEDHGGHCHLGSPESLRENSPLYEAVNITLLSLTV